jgi:uncharacterized protein involved in exopolysaccharide biosynthesis
MGSSLIPVADRDTQPASTLRPRSPDAIDPEERKPALVSRLRIIWAQRSFIVRTTMLGLVLATALAFLIPKRYQATARLMPPDNRSAPGMLAGMRLEGSLRNAGAELMGLKTPGALFVAILQSRSVKDRVITRFDLRRVYGMRRWEDARLRLAASTSVSEDRKSGVITIQVTDRSPQRAAEMAANYVEELDRLVVQLTTSAAHRERVFLEGRLEGVERDLRDAEQEFSRFASQNTAIDIKEQSKATVEAAARLEGQLIASEAELQGLREIYTDSNVRVRSVAARISELRRQLQRLGAGDQSARGAESLYPSIRQLPLLGVGYADLYRRTKVQEAVFETLTREYEMAKVEEAKETPSVKVLDPALVPERKSYPPRLAIMAMGTAFALAASVVWVLAGARWQKLDPGNPAKCFVREVSADVETQFAVVRASVRAKLPNRTKKDADALSGATGAAPLAASETHRS